MINPKYNKIFAGEFPNWIHRRHFKAYDTINQHAPFPFGANLFAKFDAHFPFLQIPTTLVFSKTNRELDLQI